MPDIYSEYEIRVMRAGIFRDDDEAVELAATGRKVTVGTVRCGFLMPGFTADVVAANNSENDLRARIEYLAVGKPGTAEAKVIALITAKTAALAAAVDAYWAARETAAC